MVYAFEDRIHLFLNVFRRKVCGEIYVGFVEHYVVRARALSQVLPVDYGLADRHMPPSWTILLFDVACKIKHFLSCIYFSKYHNQI